MAMATVCPKCDYERTANELVSPLECPRCGIIYKKYRPPREEGIGAGVGSELPSRGGRAAKSSKGSNVSIWPIVVVAILAGGYPYYKDVLRSLHQEVENESTSPRKKQIKIPPLQWFSPDDHLKLKVPGRMVQTKLSPYAQALRSASTPGMMAPTLDEDYLESEFKPVKVYVSYGHMKTRQTTVSAGMSAVTTTWSYDFSKNFKETKLFLRRFVGGGAHTIIDLKQGEREEGGVKKMVFSGRIRSENKRREVLKSAAVDGMMMVWEGSMWDVLVVNQTTADDHTLGRKILDSIILSPE
ncbi:MAG: hypothetical protein HQL52_04380 [Magnetococcales bacterium]|nr:hypothetical protein [Magnetococcales bacterium]